MASRKAFTNNHKLFEANPNPDKHVHKSKATSGSDKHFYNPLNSGNSGHI